jgi:hypothetical protein
MVGNLFYLNDDDLIENQHVYEDVAIHKITGEDIHMCEIDNEAFNMFYKPIPITKNRLIDVLGFENHLKGFLLNGFLVKRGITMQNSIITGSNNVINYLYVQLGEYAVKLEHIHQLQNLYFALTQKELEIQ